ncbi:MAG: hypothetical protein IJS02_03200 [Bacteroidales bacterium]|nr:hypothetical protein [Bacteroidales bacterium]
MYPLYNTQLLMYVAEKRHVGQMCLMAGSVLLPGEADVEAMQKAANNVLRINDALRLRFIEKDGHVWQEPLPYEERVFEVLHFKNREALHRWGRVYGTIPLKLDITSDGSIPEDRWKMKNPPLKLVLNILRHDLKMFFTKLRFHALKTQPSCFEMKLVVLPDAYGVIMKLHHVVSDAWTMMLLANQFIHFLRGETPQSYQYEDFIKSEMEFQKSGRYEKDCRFMEEQYAQCPEPTWVWPKPYTTLEAVRNTSVLDLELSSRVREYALLHDITPYTAFLTAICIFMGRKMGREKFYVGSVVINRAGVRERNTAGMFIHEVPILMNLPQTESFADAVLHVRDRSFSGFRHQKGTSRTQDTKKMLYDVWVSYQDGILEADNRAECTQYFNQYTIDTTIFTIEDRGGSGCFTVHFDHNLRVSFAEGKKVLAAVLSILSDGVKDDTRQIGSLGDGISSN